MYLNSIDVMKLAQIFLFVLGQYPVRPRPQKSRFRNYLGQYTTPAKNLQIALQIYFSILRAVRHRARVGALLSSAKQAVAEQLNDASKKHAQRLL